VFLALLDNAHFDALSFLKECQIPKHPQTLTHGSLRQRDETSTLNTYISLDENVWRTIPDAAAAKHDAPQPQWQQQRASACTPPSALRCVSAAAAAITTAAPL
jgi:hypothetical protein